MVDRLYQFNGSLISRNGSLFGGDGNCRDLWCCVEGLINTFDYTGSGILRNFIPDPLTDDMIVNLRSAGSCVNYRLDFNRTTDPCLFDVELYRVEQPDPVLIGSSQFSGNIFCDTVSFTVGGFNFTLRSTGNQRCDPVTLLPTNATCADVTINSSPANTCGIPAGTYRLSEQFGSLRYNDGTLSISLFYNIIGWELSIIYSGTSCVNTNIPNPGAITSHATTHTTGNNSVCLTFGEC